ncbi:MAG: lipid II flippase MurJ [Ferruginibacter sp.]
MLKSESYRKGVINSSLLNILAKGLVFLNAIIISYYFGTTNNTDIYFYIVAVAALLCGAINGIDYLVLVPEAINIRTNQSDLESKKFFNFFFFLYLFIGFIILTFSYIIPIAFFNAFSKFDVNILKGFKEVLLMGSFIIFFQIVNNLMIAILTSYKYFTIAIFSSFINSLLSIILTVIFHSKWGISGSVFGLLIGYIINFIILIFTLKAKLKWSFKKVKILKEKNIWKNIFFMQINIVPVWVKNYIILLLISGMIAGTLSAYNLGNNIAIIPEVFIIAQILNVAGIKFSELYALKFENETKELFYKILDSLLIIIFPITIILSVCSTDIIEIIFLRGKFSAENVHVTSKCLFFISLLLPIKVYDLLCTRLFTSNQLYSYTVLIATLIHLSFTAFTYYLSTKYQLDGLLYSFLIGNYIFLLAGFSFIILKKCPFIIDKQRLVQIVILICFSILVFIVSFYLHSVFRGFNNFIKLCAIIFIVLLLYGLFIFKQKSNYLFFKNILINK